MDAVNEASTVADDGLSVSTSPFETLDSDCRREHTDALVTLVVSSTERVPLSVMTESETKSSGCRRCEAAKELVHAQEARAEEDIQTIADLRSKIEELEGEVWRNTPSGNHPDEAFRENLDKKNISPIASKESQDSLDTALVVDQALQEISTILQGAEPNSFSASSVGLNPLSTNDDSSSLVQQQVRNDHMKIVQSVLEMFVNLGTNVPAGSLAQNILSSNLFVGHGKVAAAWSTEATVTVHERVTEIHKRQERQKLAARKQQTNPN